MPITQLRKGKMKGTFCALLEFREFSNLFLPQTKTLLFALSFSRFWLLAEMLARAGRLLQGKSSISLGAKHISGDAPRPDVDLFGAPRVE